MKTAWIIQQVPFEDAGSFAPMLQHLGYNLRVIDAPVADWAALDPREPNLLLVMGGPIGVYQIREYPFLTAQIRLIQARLEAGLPVLGICLGAQLLAAALGARVYPAGVKEIGWKPLTLTLAGEDSCLAPLGDTPVLHWHGDTFDLPSDALLLASTDVCQNQAFRYGKAVGLQFHSEVTAVGLERWYVAHAAELQAAGLDVAELRAASQRHAPILEQHGKAMLQRWLMEMTVPPTA
jgi:GMP synthase (glutamine-hydrolysing)